MKLKKSSKAIGPSSKTSKGKANGYSLLYANSESASYINQNGLKKRAGTAPKTSGGKGSRVMGIQSKYGNKDRLGRLLHSGSANDNRMFNFFRSKDSRPKRSTSKTKKKASGHKTTGLRKGKSLKKNGSSFTYLNKGRESDKQFLTHSPKKTSKDKKKKLRYDNIGYETSKSSGFSSRFYSSHLLRNTRKSRNLKTSASRKTTSRPKGLANSKSRKKNDKSKSRKKTSTLGSLVTQVKHSNLGTGSFFSNHEKTSKRTKKRFKSKQQKKSVPGEISLSSLRYKNIFYMQKLEIAFKSYSNDNISVLYRKHFKQCVQSLGLLRKIAKSKNPIPKEKLVELAPLPSKKKTIIFDLDETLIHCNEDQASSYDVKVPVHFPTGEFIEAGINIRPHAKEILQELSEEFEVLIFTASHSCYANPVIDYLDPENKYVKMRLFRDNCVQITDGLYVKDLDILLNRNLKDVVLIDNAAYSYSMQLKNGIPIVPFYDDKSDTELIELKEFLFALKDVSDVRNVISGSFKGGLISKYSNNMGLLFKKLFDI